MAKSEKVLNLGVTIEGFKSAFDRIAVERNVPQLALNDIRSFDREENSRKYWNHERINHARKIFGFVAGKRCRVQRRADCLACSLPSYPRHAIN